MFDLSNILVPLDGSALSESALPPAMSLAQKFEGHIILLRVVDVPREITLSSPVEWRIEAQEQAYEISENYLKGREAELRKKGFNVSILVHDTSPAKNIIDTAAKMSMDVIVMSTHGRGGIARWAVGSVADKVARHSPCPVLLVRQPAENTKKL